MVSEDRPGMPSQERRGPAGPLGKPELAALTAVPSNGWPDIILMAVGRRDE